MGCSTATTQSFSVPAYVPPTPAPPSSVTVGTPQVTGPNAWNAPVSWPGVSGASSYTVSLDGAVIQSGITGTSITLHGTNPGQNHTVGVSACN